MTQRSPVTDDQWLLEHRRLPRAQLIDATHVLVLAALDHLSSGNK